jgi:hypothetical protein
MNVKLFRAGLTLAALTVVVVVPPAMSQTPAAIPATPPVGIADPEIPLTGWVVSSSKSTLTVRIEGGLYTVFTFDRYTKKPPSVALGSKVRVMSLPTGEAGVRVATNVTVLAVPGTTPPSSETGSADRSAEKPYEAGEAVPVTVRKLENSLEQGSKKYGLGFRGGMGLDPEVFLIGVQGRIGPFFDKGLSFRPNLDFGFGEVTKLFALDLNLVYRLPVNSRTSKWGMFVGAGPSLMFSHRNFEEAAAGENSIDFGDFSYNTGLNFLGGVEFRSGLFVEAKATAWAGPHLRLTFGYSF